MMDDAPVKIVMISGTGSGTGDGGLSPAGVLAKTEGDHPNYLVSFISPLVAISVRFGNTFLVSLVGLLTAAMTPAGGKLLYTTDFTHLLVTCASLSLPIACLNLLKDLVTIFGKLEASHPLATGSI